MKEDTNPDKISSIRAKRSTIKLINSYKEDGETQEEYILKIINEVNQ